MDFSLLIFLPAVLGAGYVIWNLWFKRVAAPLQKTQTRRREDARDWQRRFGTESLLTANFLQPTQNEILETLYVLDHLTPGWEAGDPALEERHFLDELALNFPTLRKPTCEFPLPFAESLSALSSRAHGPGAPQVREEVVAAKREEFRVARAQANALDQIASGPAGPTVMTPGSLPFRASNEEPDLRRGNPWPARVAGAAVLGAAIFGIVRLRPNGATLPSPPEQREMELALAEGTPAPTPVTAGSTAKAPAIAGEEPAASPAPAAPAPPTPPPALAMASVATPDAVTVPPASSTPDPRKVALDQQIAASKQRALGKYPSLAVEGSEINLRFVFRYKALSQQNSARLLDPSWPEKLVEECAADSGSAVKRSVYSQARANH